MGVFEHFPYVNIHELNLDWIINKLKELEDVVGNQIVDIVARAGVAANTQAISDLQTEVNNNKTTAHNEAVAAQSTANAASNAAGNAQTAATNAGNAATAAQNTANSITTAFNNFKVTTGNIAGNSSKVFTIDNSSRIMVICLSFNTDEVNIFMLASTSGGAVAAIPIKTSADLTATTSTNQLTLTNNSGSSVYTYALVFAGSIT